MPTVDIKTKISFDELLQAVLQLDAPNFTKFIQEAQTLRKELEKNVDTEREQYLLEQIKEELSQEDLERMELLKNKPRNEITVAEEQEMEQLMARSNQLHLKIEIATYLYKKGWFSMGQAKQLSGLDQISFQRELAERKIDIRLSTSEMEKEFAAIKNIKSKLRT